MPIDEYQFVECSNTKCKLRFPGAANIACPICNKATKLVATRSKGYTGPDEKRDSFLELFLDNVRSAYNVGSIIRTADGAGIKKLHFAGITPTANHPSVAKTALGAEKNILWHRGNNSLELAEELKRQGKKLWCLERLENSSTIYLENKSADLSQVVLIVGNEVTGVDPGLLKICDKIVHIPMRGSKISLNVATATGIALFALLPTNNT